MGAIVVGTDGTQTAGRAVAVAAGVARAFGASLHIVHGYRPPGSGDDHMADVWLQSSQAILDEAKADPALDGITVECHSVAGGPADAVVDVARQVHADFIVVGNRGLHGRTAGSGGPELVPEQVARNAPCHVVIAKTT
jgi:nucleotide-binding universal stress UspA family protein